MEVKISDKGADASESSCHHGRLSLLATVGGQLAQVARQVTVTGHPTL